jgi:predicted O-methyltransferase YrrM
MTFDEVEIPTWTEPETLNFLANLVRYAQFGVELGTYFGASARAMLRGNPYLHLWSVDHFQVFGSRQISEMFLDRWIKSGNCELITGDSSTASKMLQHMNGKIDFVFVDDGHDTQQVATDIQFMLPLIRPGGTLCGHDFDIPHNDVALGVIQSGIKFDIPIPRLWRHVKQ